MTKSLVTFSISVFLTLVMMLASPSHPSVQSVLDGNWQTGEDNSVVKIEPVL